MSPFYRANIGYQILSPAKINYPMQLYINASNVELSLLLGGSDPALEPRSVGKWLAA